MAEKIRIELPEHEREAPTGSVSQWYCVRSSTRQEHKLVTALEERHMTPYMPMETVWSGLQRKRIHRPAMRGYMFVLTEPERLCEIEALEYFHAFVGYLDRGGQSHAWVVPFSVILGIQCEEMAGDYDSTKAAKPPPYRPRKGDRIKAVRGTYMTFFAKVINTPKGDRVHVMIEDPHTPHGATLNVADVIAA